jgi:glycosyltransferase involved in cell wall biosynthesis
VTDPVVLHVLEALEGGTARHVIDVVTHVGDTEHHVAIPSVRVGGMTDRQAAQRLQDAGATVHVVEMRRSPVTLTNARAVNALRRLVRDARVDLVHGHSSIGGALARVVAFAARRPCVYTPNGLAPARAAIVLERLLARRTARIIAVSASEAALLEHLHVAPPEQVTVIPNGVAVDPPPRSDAATNLRRLLGLAPATPLVGTVARLVPQKAPERFVALAADVHRRHRDAQFVLIGDGPQRDDITRLVTAADLDNWLHLIPEVPDAAATLGQLDVFVLASRFEGGPYAPLEAMRAGTPVVLTDVVGNRDVVEPGRSGFLVAEPDAAALAGTVLDLLLDPDLRTTVGRAGAERVRADFDVAKAGSALRAVYGSLVA